MYFNERPAVTTMAAGLFLRTGTDLFCIYVNFECIT